MQPIHNDNQSSSVLKRSGRQHNLSAAITKLQQLGFRANLSKSYCGSFDEGEERNKPIGVTPKQGDKL